MMLEKTFKINGMTCAACVRAVEKAVLKIDGIEKVNVNLATEKMTVSFQGKVKIEEIIEAVDKAGYGATLDESLKEVTIPVEGMT